MIPAGKTVNVANQQTYVCVGAMKVTILGVLTFQNGKKISFPCGSKIYLQSGGKIDTQGGGGNSNYIAICGVELWTAGFGDVFGPLIIVCCSPLPIELVHFTATPQNNYVNLNWTTVTETNNDFFTIEKSKDAIHFEEVGKIKGAGNSSITHNYSLADEDPIIGTSYYRLKQTDFDGASTYSQIVPVEFNSSAKWVFTIYPNPSVGESTTIDFSDAVTEDVVFIEVNDLVGKRVSISQFNISNSHKVNIISSGSLSAGVYTVTARTVMHTFTQKLVIE